MTEQQRKTLARWLVKTRIFVLGRPQYMQFYDWLYRQRLPWDSRSKRRARWKAWGFGFIVSLTLTEITNYYVAGLFGFAPFTWNWFVPYVILEYWAWQLSHYIPPNGFNPQAMQAISQHNLTVGLVLTFVDTAVVLIVGAIIYFFNAIDRTLLSTEKGAAQWILPEDLAKTGVLPDNYDIYAGFDQSELDRIKYDADLQADQSRRIAAYAKAVLEWEAKQQTTTNQSPILTLPVYGDSDVTFAQGDSQTNHAAPWLEEQVPTQTMPAPPSDLKLPEF